MRILFACIAADGHFNPLTGIAMHLKQAGHDVRWYTGASMAGRLDAMGIALSPFRRAVEVTGENIPERFPERARLHGPALIRFDGEKIFLANVPAYYADIREIDREFGFDLLFCDAAFFGARPVRELLGKRVAVLQPWSESISDDPWVPPPFLGLGPADGAARRWAYRGLKWGMDLMVNRHLLRTYNAALAGLDVDQITWSVFDEAVRVSDVCFLNGVPGLAYRRAHPDPKEIFLGACPPYRDPARPKRALPEGVGTRSGQTVLVSQGTVDNHDPDKLIVPTLRALRGSGVLVLVATGNSRLTRELRPLYAGPDVVIEDWIDFDAVLPNVDVFVCNGGSGSLLASFSHGVPVVVAGTREGKNDNNVHVGYFGLGVNLRTERPTPRALRHALARVLVEPVFRRNVDRLRAEIARYRPHEIVERQLATLVAVERRP